MTRPDHVEVTTIQLPLSGVCAYTRAPITVVDLNAAGPERHQSLRLLVGADTDRAYVTYSRFFTILPSATDAELG